MTCAGLHDSATAETRGRLRGDRGCIKEMQSATRSNLTYYRSINSCQWGVMTLSKQSVLNCFGLGIVGQFEISRVNGLSQWVPGKQNQILDSGHCFARTEQLSRQDRSSLLGLLGKML